MELLTDERLPDDETSERSRRRRFRRRRDEFEYGGGIAGHKSADRFGTLAAYEAMVDQEAPGLTRSERTANQSTRLEHTRVQHGLRTHLEPM